MPNGALYQPQDTSPQLPLTATVAVTEPVTSAAASPLLQAEAAGSPAEPAKAVPESGAIGEAAIPAVAVAADVVSPRLVRTPAERKRDMQAMLKVSGSRFIAVKTDKEVIIAKTTVIPLRNRSPTVEVKKSSDEEEAAVHADGKPGTGEDDAEDDSDDDADDDNDNDDNDEEDEDDYVDDDDDHGFYYELKENVTLEMAIKEQRLGAIAAILRKIESGQQEKSLIPSLLKGNDAPGGSPLHFAAGLSAEHKRRDKVFEYLLNYSIKHRQRKEDDEAASITPNDTAGYAMQEERMGRKRKQSYTKDAMDEGDDAEGAEHIPSWKWIDAPNWDGNTALHVAARQGFLFAVNILLQDGMVDPDIVNNLGNRSAVGPHRC
jgi:hypothetical protein